MGPFLYMYQQGREDPNKVYINEEIRSHELRVMGPDGENLGVLQKRDAVAEARERGLDLILVSAKAVPPVAKIMDYGKFTYEQKKKAKEVKANSFVTETKNVQVKIGTGEHDKMLKAKRVVEWLQEGHRVKVDLFLWGRYKYMDKDFLMERLKHFLDVIPVPFKIAESIKKSPKGYSCTIERDKNKPMPTNEEIRAALEATREEKEAKQEEAEKTNA